MLLATLFCRHGARQFHSSGLQSAVSKAALSKLRKKTGFPFVKCKNALAQFDNDTEKAETWLREQAQKEGWAKATKLQDRAMSQGLVGLVVDSKHAAMVEVNCETDFVSRNSKFHSLVSQLANHCLDWGKARSENKIILGTEAAKQLPTAEGKTLSDLVAMEIGNIGENMRLSRVAIMNANESNNIGTYIHAVGIQQTKEGKCTMGKFGAMVTFSQSAKSTESGDADTLSAEDIGRQICQHIVGMNPSTIGTSEDKPNKNSDEESKMIFQEFLLDSTITVGDYLTVCGASVHDFVRFESGEEKLKEEPSTEEVYVTQIV